MTRLLVLMASPSSSRCGTGSAWGVVALCVLTFLCAARSSGADWPGYVLNALLGLDFGVELAFGDALADVLNGK
jgi:hypothetical protein